MMIRPAPDLPADLLLASARLMDPKSGLDCIGNIAITGGVISYIGPDRKPARRTHEMRGMVVAPGFIDLHSHAQTPTGLALQALDGVTTALDLEAGMLPVALQYQRAEEEGRPINFGFSASWGVARMSVVAGLDLADASSSVPLESGLNFVQRNQANSDWLRTASQTEVTTIIDVLEEGVREGGIGIGVLLGYSPESGTNEYLRVAQLGERLGVPIFTHSRRMSNEEPGSSLDGILEIIAVGATTGASMHICHVNSTSLRMIDQVSLAIQKAQHLGVAVTTEAYPYPTASTGIGAAFLDPSGLSRLGLQPSDIRYLRTGNRIANAEELADVRRADPGGLCLVDYLRVDHPEDKRLLLETFAIPGTVVASDAVPLTIGDAQVHDEWPVPSGARAHPRSWSTFARTIRWLVNDESALDLMDALARASYLPARILESCVPDMRRKGRLEVGADADLVGFYPAEVLDSPAYTDPEPSRGFNVVLVAGEYVVRDGTLVVGARPGRPIRSQISV